MFSMEDWELNLLKIDNHNDVTSRLRHYYKFIKEKADTIEGDILEFGVFQGHSLLATALILKNIGSKKIVWGFDSFEGFPAINSKDHLDRFFDSPNFSEAFKEKIKRFLDLKSKFEPFKSVRDVSSSVDFSDTSLASLEARISHLGLENIRLIKGPFDQTLKTIGAQIGKVFACNIDCDLYEGYLDALNFLEPRIVKEGFVHLDEYYSFKFPGAKLAVDEFLKNSKLQLEQLPSEPTEFERWCLRR